MSCVESIAPHFINMLSKEASCCFFSCAKLKGQVTFLKIAGRDDEEAIQHS